MTDLVEFLRARVAEDRAWADNPECTEDPARVLREVEAKRRIVDEHSGREVASLESESWAQTFVVCRTCRLGERQIVAPCPTLRLLALPYADRPDYREEWKP